MAEFFVHVNKQVSSTEMRDLSPRNATNKFSKRPLLQAVSHK